MEAQNELDNYFISHGIYCSTSMHYKFSKLLTTVEKKANLTHSHRGSII